VFIEFTRLEETGNYVVLATVCTIFGVYILVVIWARKADMFDERKVDIIDTSEIQSALANFI